MSNPKKENIKKLNNICKHIKKKTEINLIKINIISKDINDIEERIDHDKEIKNIESTLDNI